MKKNSKNQIVDLEKTFKYGVAGGIMGVFIGAPGLGMAAGMLAANKKPIEKYVKKADKDMDKYMKW